MNKTFIILGLIIILVVMSGCSTTEEKYEERLTTCLENTPEKHEYCLCFAGCVYYSNCYNKCDKYLSYSTYVIE